MMLSMLFAVVTATSISSPNGGLATLEKQAESDWLAGRYEEALSGYRKMLAQQGDRDAVGAVVLGNIAELERTLGRFREAEKHARRSLEVRQRLLAPDHPDIAAALNNVGEVLRSQRQYKASEELYRKALAILDRQNIVDRAQLAAVLTNLGQALTSQGKDEEAERVLTRAVETWTQAGETDRDRAIALNNLANLMTHRRRYAEAERLYREVLAIARRALAPGHLNTLLIQVNLADVLRLQKRFGEAEPLFQSTLRDMEALVGPDHPERAAALEMYAALLRDTGRRKVAKVTLAEAKEIRQRHARIDGSALVVDARSL